MIFKSIRHIPGIKRPQSMLQEKKGFTWFITGFLLLAFLSLTFLVLMLPLSRGKAQSSGWIPSWVDLGDSGIIHLINGEVDSENKPSQPGNQDQFFSDRQETGNPSSYVPVGWTTIFSDDMEGTFPGGWNVFDNDGATNGTYYWAKRNCRPHGGSYSAWVVGGGADGGNLTCGSDYPDYAKSWMVYGPFSLEDATDAEFRFMFWLNSELGYDLMFAGASIDGSNFYGASISGAYDWTERVFDLTDVYTLGDLTGQPQVWVVIAFQSDVNTHFAEGVYIDDVEILKFVEGESTPTPTPTPSPSATSSTVTTTPATNTPTVTQTPTPENRLAFLPVIKNKVEPPPTSTPTPTSTITLTPTITPTPTATSEGAVPNDGNWAGTTNQGRNISLLVVSGGTQIDTITISVGWGGACGVSSTTYFLYDAIINNGHFYKSQSNGTSVSGDFTSSTEASGSFYAVLEVFYPSYCHATTSGTWSASFVP